MPPSPPLPLRLKYTPLGRGAYSRGSCLFHRQVLARPRELACLHWLTMELEMTKIARIALIANPLLQSRGEIAQANDWGEGCAQLAVPPAKQRRKK